MSTAAELVDPSLLGEQLHWNMSGQLPSGIDQLIGLQVQQAKRWPDSGRPGQRAGQQRRRAPAGRGEAQVGRW